MRILVLDPHGDDWIYCAGALVKHIKNDDTIVYINFSTSEESLKGDFTKDDYLNEMSKSLNCIGITKIYTLNYPVRNFGKYRQEILDNLISYRNKYKPDIVYTPSTYDSHQDHSVICNESIRAFAKSASIFGYDICQNVIDSNINRYVELTDDEISIKVKCSNFYKSQLYKKEYSALGWRYILSLAAVRGNKIGVKYAEAFHVIVLRY